MHEEAQLVKVFINQLQQKDGKLGKKLHIVSCFHLVKTFMKMYVLAFETKKQIEQEEIPVKYAMRNTPEELSPKIMQTKFFSALTHSIRSLNFKEYSLAMKHFPLQVAITTCLLSELPMAQSEKAQRSLNLVHNWKDYVDMPYKHAILSKPET